MQLWPRAFTWQFLCTGLEPFFPLTWAPLGNKRLKGLIRVTYFLPLAITDEILQSCWSSLILTDLGKKRKAVPSLLQERYPNQVSTAKAWQCHWLFLMKAVATECISDTSTGSSDMDLVSLCSKWHSELFTKKILIFIFHKKMTEVQRGKAYPPQQSHFLPLSCAIPKGSCSLQAFLYNRNQHSQKANCLLLSPVRWSGDRSWEGWAGLGSRRTLFTSLG